MPNKSSEPLPEFKQPERFIQFQVVPETNRLNASIYALDVDGWLWFRLLTPPLGDSGWIREELCGVRKP